MSEKTLPSPEVVREKETLTPEEMAVMLGCGRTFAYKLLADGVIPNFKIGAKLRRVRRADVEAFITERLGASAR
jgi:excisionase family DNA binding protein